MRVLYLWLRLHNWITFQWWRLRGYPEPPEWWPEARICGQCQKVCGPHQPDPCLGILPGVTGACCGHGKRHDAFIGFADGGPLIRGFWVDTHWRREIERLDRIHEEEEGKQVMVQIPIHVDGLSDEEGAFTEEVFSDLGRMVIDMARDEAKRQQITLL